MEVGEEVCATRKIKEGKRRKRVGKWNEEIRRVVGRKRECFLIWRRTRTEVEVRVVRMERLQIRIR